MSQDFITVLAAPDQPVAILMASADNRLTELGFRRGSSIYREDLESDEKPEEAVRLRSSLSDAMAELMTWNAASMEFRKAGLTLELIGVRWSAGFSNCFVRTELKSFVRLYQGGAIREYYDAITALASAIGSPGGFGDVELDLAPAKPEQVAQRIRDNPGNKGQPCSIGLFSTAVMNDAQIDPFAGDAFVVLKIGNYWLLEERSYREVFPRLRT